MMKMIDANTEVPEGAIAIVGMAGRFPGAPSVERLWENLLAGRSGISRFAVSDDSSGKHVPVGAMLDDVDRFDAGFFDITPRDATTLDPQRRFFLECAWEALENAGIDPFAHDGAIGVYAGMSASHYLSPTMDMFERPYEDFQALLGNDKDNLATFLAYKLNLRGPAVSVQTACSTSLVAVHFACSSLLSRECDVVLAGGVTIRLPQGKGYKYEEGFIQSPDGHCRAFDAGANGTVFGNGVGVVVLKRLEDALADGDRIRAVIRGSAINNDGSAKVGFTAPSVVGQANVIAEALSVAGVDARSIHYIEAHGTGTALGDPIEMAALKQAFAGVREKGKIAIGALKSNVGHLESAAGVAGLIKTVRAIEHGMIPANPEFVTPNPEIGIAESPFYIRAETHAWRTGSEPRRAGVSSFGIGGTNAHVIVEEAPVREEKPIREASSYLLPLSAKTPEALLVLAKSYQQWLSEKDERFDDIVYTTSSRRAHWAHRLGVVGANNAEIAAALGAFAAGEIPVGLVNGKATQTPPKVVFVFPGQGSQWVGMGRQLRREEPAFHDALVMCDEAIRKEAGFSVVEELDKPEETSRFSDIDVVQPVLFAIEVALAALWRSWGVEPAAVVGHSMGEVAAAFVAGALSMGDAAAIICRRSRLLRKVAGQGAMALVELTMPHAEKALVGYEGRLSVAVSNGPRSSVIAGDPAALDEVLGKLERDGVFCRRVKVDVASHSPQMDPLREDLLRALATISPKEASIPMRSTVTGERIRGNELSSTYWTDNLRKPVLFSKVIEQWITDGHTIFVEMSPHPILTPSVEENLREANAEGVALASTRRAQDERQTMLSSLGALFVRGVPVVWKAFFPDSGRVVELPTYPWQRERYWRESSKPTAAIGVSQAEGSEHALLGLPFSVSTHADERIWQQSIRIASIPWLAEHRVQDEVVFPGAGYIELALAAGAKVFGDERVMIEDLAFERLMAFGENDERDIQVVLVPEGGGSSVQINSRAKDVSAWTTHARGFVRLGAKAPRPIVEEPKQISARVLHAMDVSAFYQGIRDRQMYHGPPFQGIVELRAGETEVLAKIRLPEDVRDAGYVMHPALLDACLQVSGALLMSSNTDTYVPVGMKRFALHAPPERELWVLATKRQESGVGGDMPACDLQLMDEHGQVFVAVDRLRLQKISQNARKAEDALADCVYEVAWRSLDALPEPMLPAGGNWVVFADQGGMGKALQTRLTSMGQRCIRVESGATYQQNAPDLFQIDPLRVDDVRRLLRELFGNERHCEGVVFLSSLDVTLFERTTSEGLMTDVTRACTSAAYVARAIVRHGFRDAPRFFLVTRGAQSIHATDPVSVTQAPMLGLGKTITMEHPEVECARIDLSPAIDERDVDLLLRELGSKQREDQIALRGESRYAARLVRGEFEVNEARQEKRMTESTAGRPFRLEIRKPGVLENLALYEMQTLRPGPGEVLIAVEATGLNFRDVLLTLGVVPDDAEGAYVERPRLGYECAGRVVAVGEDETPFVIGDEVLAFATDAFGSHTKTKIAHCVKKPSNLTWEQAATLPIVFMTAYYALRDVGRIEKGERILIHAGTGGVGLAAIQVAQHIGAEIFATAGSDSKRDYLRSLGIKHVFDSRSLGFVDDIKRITNGEGVDLVLNSLAGDFIPASLSLLRSHGRFLEIGLRDAYENSRIGLRPFLRNLSFSLIDLRGFLQERPERARKMFQEVVDLVASGVFAPPPVRVFSVSRALEAFQYLAQAKHIGKLALMMKDPDAHFVPLRQDASITIREDRTYLITGGLGGLGFSLAKWFVEQGARSLVLVGRNGPSEEARGAIRVMEETGARVHCAQADVSRPSDVDKLFSMIQDGIPPLGGIVHAAMVLDDHMLLEMEEAHFRRVIAPKVIGAWNLHAISKDHALDFFVMYSSVGALLGSPGQGNYTAANTFMDALAYERSRLGLPAMSIQWGGFAEVGAAVAEHRGKRLSHRGISSFSPSEGLDAFGRLLAHPRPLVSVARLDLRQWVEFYPAARDLPMFADLLTSESTKKASAGKSALRQTLTHAQPSTRFELLAKHIAEQVGLVLQIDPARLDRNVALQQIGMDSLASLELRNRLEATLNERLSATVTFTYPSVAALAKHLLNRMKLDPAALPPVAPLPAALPSARQDAEVALDDDDAMLALFDAALEHAEKI